jgi:hypothetical protein
MFINIASGPVQGLSVPESVSCVNDEHLFVECPRTFAYIIKRENGGTGALEADPDEPVVFKEPLP